MHKLSLSLLKKLLIGSLFSLFLVNTALAVYKAPKKPSRPQTTTSNASRNNGCLKDTNSKLTILAPVGHIGQTVSQKPTFAWFLPESEPRKMEFTLYEYAGNARGKKVKSFELESKPRKIMAFSPAKEGFKFEKGKTYLWQIAFLCDRNNPMKDIFAEAVIKIVPTPVSLASQLTQTTNPLKRAQAFANAGFWYDAFVEALENNQGQVFQFRMLTKLSQLETQAAAGTSEKLLKQNLETQASQLERIACKIMGLTPKNSVSRGNLCLK